MNKNIKKMIRRKKFIGAGAKRAVYDLRNGYVLKKAKSNRGVRSNNLEVRIYKSAPPKIKKHLGRIKTYGDGYWWITMKYYPFIFKKTKNNMRKLFAIKAKFRKYGIDPLDVTKNGKPNYDNIRQKPSGRIVVIDYGNFKWRRTRHARYRK